LRRLHAPRAATSTSFFYQSGLLLVAAAMVLLPVLYAGLIAAAGWRLFLATHFHFLVTSLWRARVFCLNCALLRTVVCRNRPGPLHGQTFFAPRPRHAQPLALNPAAEPLLFSFIAKVAKRSARRFPANRSGLPAQRGGRFPRGPSVFWATTRC